MKRAVLWWLLPTSLVFLLSPLYASHEFFSLHKLQLLEKDYGTLARRRAEALQDLMTQLINAPEKEKISRINEFFNQMRFCDDKMLWGVKDYWATRMEFIGKDAGDCEDFAIAKYFTLKELGVPVHKLQFDNVKIFL